MKADDIIYGARSAVQKSIRRGDLDLCKTAIDILWADSTQRQWLKWRSPTLAIEEAWYMGAELQELIESKSDKEKDWRKFLYKLCLTKKTRDATALWRLCDLGWAIDSGENEIIEMYKWKKKVIGNGGDPASVVDELVSHVEKVVEMSSYEEEALKFFRDRVFMGGMLGDRCQCLGAIVLLMNRPIDRKEVLSLISNGKERWKKKINRVAPRAINLPWYVFDAHTQAGGMAMKVFMKKQAAKYGFSDTEHFRKAWFVLESAYIPPDMVDEENPVNAVSAYQQTWWPYFVEEILDMGGHKHDYWKQKWDSKICGEMEKIVNWCLDKREN